MATNYDEMFELARQALDAVRVENEQLWRQKQAAGLRQRLRRGLRRGRPS